jgi:putative FmdB family regulatory protein
MPTYEYLCAEHGRFTEIRLMSRRHDLAACPVCERVAVYCISAPRVFGDFEGYESPASGRWVEGKRQRLEDFKRTGTRAYEGGEREAAEVRRKDEEKQADARVDQCVDEAVGELRSN